MGPFYVFTFFLQTSLSHRNSSISKSVSFLFTLDTNLDPYYDALVIIVVLPNLKENCANSVYNEPYITTRITHHIPGAIILIP